MLIVAFVAGTLIFHWHWFLGVLLMLVFLDDMS